MDGVPDCCHLSRAQMGAGAAEGHGTGLSRCAGGCADTGGAGASEGAGGRVWAGCETRDGPTVARLGRGWLAGVLRGVCGASGRVWPSGRPRDRNRTLNADGADDEMRPEPIALAVPARTAWLGRSRRGDCRLERGMPPLA